MTNSPFAKDEVIPRQCSLRTLPSSDASAKPWVARPISVPQNLVNWHGAVVIQKILDNLEAKPFFQSESETTVVLELCWSFQNVFFTHEVTLS